MAPVRRKWVPAGLALGAGLVAIVLGWTAPGIQADSALHDFYQRLQPPPPRPMSSAVIAFDDKTLMATGFVRGLRPTLARVLERLQSVRPAVVAVDLTLADQVSPAEDQPLAAAFGKTPRLVLASEMMQDGSGWQDPIPAFASSAKALGHVNALPDPFDKITRAIALERVAARRVRWALSLEAYRVWKDIGRIVSSPTDVAVGDLHIESRWDEGRPFRVHYRPDGHLPVVSALALLNTPGEADRLRDKVVFVGVTAQSAVVDRLFTPLSIDVPMPGVLIHAQAFETMAGREFLYDAPLWVSVVLSLALACAVGAAFLFLPAWAAYGSGVALIVAAHVMPGIAFSQGTVLPGFSPAAAAWFAFLACGSWQFFVVRRELQHSEGERQRYQQAFHFVAHEMRTPLTAIQGSSELISRYNLPEDKRKELGGMINAESKRLARMITTFLDVERLSAGQMELRRSEVPVGDLVDACIRRARPLAEKKQIQLEVGEMPGAAFTADRELVEYAVYNLVTNAIKYSPPDTRVEIKAERNSGETRISVRDQGIGMDEKEVKQIFHRFYRTGKAVASGETGTGIGLSIVDQIVAQHGGRIEVQSRPNEGSCFTIIFPAGSTLN